MEKTLLLLLLLFSSTLSIGQVNSFEIQETHFENKKIKFFSENRGGGVVVLENDSILLMNKNLEFANVTTRFNGNISLEISCVESIDENTFLLGTANHSLYLFRKDSVYDLKTLNPELPLKINSIDFKGSTHDKQVLVATDSNQFLSNDLLTYVKDEVNHTSSITYFDGRKMTLLDNYNYCNSIPGEYGIMLRENSSVLYFKVLENDTLNFEILNDVVIAKRGFGSGYFNSFAMYGTEKGIYAQHLDNCSSYVIEHFNNTTVYDFELIRAQQSTILIASDSGLLHFDAEGSYWDVLSPSYEKIDGIDTAYSITHSRYHNNVWISTNNGLVVLSMNGLERESFSPEPSEFRNIYYCESNGAYLRANVNDQVGIDWYRNDTLINNAISNQYHTKEEGVYYAIYEYDDIIDTIQIANVRLDTIFDLNIEKPSYLICPGSNSAIVRAINNSDEESLSIETIQWFSVERGLELEATDQWTYSAQESGNYYFISTNCNNLSYTSDTVQVIKSPLEELKFSLAPYGEGECLGDTVFLQGADSASTIEWSVNQHIIDSYEEKYWVFNEEDANSNFQITITDKYGCQLQEYSHSYNIFTPPSISDKHYYICDSSALINIPVDFATSIEWAGNIDNILQPVQQGTYPISISHIACPTVKDTIMIEQFNPYALDNFLFYAQTGDTVKIPVSGEFPINWTHGIQSNVEDGYVYITSNIADTISTELTFSSEDCSKTYEIEVVFEKILSVNNLSFKVYPNPTSDAFYLEFPDEYISQITVTDIAGRHIFSTVDNLISPYKVDLHSEMEPGIYILRILTVNESTEIRKIIVK